MPGDAGTEAASGRPKGRHPLVGVCLAFALGTWLGVRTLGGGARPWIALAAAAAAWAASEAAARRTSRRRLRRAAAALAAVAAPSCALLVAFVAARAEARRRMDAVELFRDAAEERADVVLRGRVANDPSAVALDHGGARIRFDLEVGALAHEAGDIPAGGCRVRVDWYGPVSLAGGRPPFPLPRAGEGWQIGGRLVEVPTRSAAPLLVLARRERDSATRRVPELDAPPWRLALRDVRAWGSAALARGVDPERLGAKLVRAMVLGFRSDVPPEVSEAFQASGTVHVFAISGLHVGVFARALATLLALLALPRRWRPFLSVPLLALYVLLTGARPSAARAGTMAAVALAAPLAGRRADPATSLCFAAAAILAAAPMQILDLGFAFSFLCTGGILSVRPTMERLMRRPPGVLGSVRAGIRCAAFVSVVAWLFSAPLTAMCFGRLSPAAIVCNLAVVPLATGTVTVSVLSLVLAPLAPPLSILCNRAACLCAEGMAFAARAVADVPGAAWNVEPWNPAAVLLWYAALVPAVLFLRRHFSLDE
jgi:competence protein ComEC